MQKGIFELNHDDRLVSVCSACYPGESAWALPELSPSKRAGYQLTHGICKHHAKIFKLAAIKRNLGLAHANK